MTKPFDKTEIRKATSSMKNGKSCGIDGLNAEYLKYAPPTIHTSVAELLNKTAATGDHPLELKLGILNPLQKPGKKKGPRENLRPIILLSIIRKILTICILRRTWNRLSEMITIDQAAYQGGRSTTEQVFAIKTLAEKAIGSSNFKIYLLLLDMSKAFDTVNRNKLFDALETILLPEELHLLHLLTNNVKLQVRVGSETSEEFNTILGIMQGDCLSAVLFIFYLAQALAERNSIEAEHNYAQHMDKQHPNATPMKSTVTIEPKYADDITYASTSKPYIDNIKETIPSKLKMYNLGVNIGKTEEYTIPDVPDITPNKSWKTCKLLGSIIDTESDIKRRKALAISVLTQHKKVYQSKNLSIDQKIRHYRMYIESTLLYNCELWTLNKTLCDKLDAFHRRLLRYAIGITYPKIIKNEAIYKITNQVEISKTIQSRRLSWFGHLMRLPVETPARIAFNEAIKPRKNKRGRPKTSWLDTVQKDFNELKININIKDINSIPKLTELCADRASYRAMTKTCCGMQGNPARTKNSPNRL